VSRLPRPGHWEWRRLLTWPNGQLCEGFPTTEPAAREDCALAYDLDFIQEQHVRCQLQRRWVPDWQTVDEFVGLPPAEPWAG
jgi:hypothetical protein